MDLEQELKGALARRPAPEGFAQRVAARAARPTSRPSAMRWAAAAAVLAGLAGSGAAYRRHQGEVAKEQVMTAMRITAVKLHHIQTHVLEVQQ